MIFEEHLINPNWGVRPILFYLNKSPVTSYSFFILLAIIVAIIYSSSKKQHDPNILIAGLVGGAIGAKLLFWLVNIKFFLNNKFTIINLLSGRTIIGGILGGYLSIFIYKKINKIDQKRGNFIAPGLALGIAIGRIGCFLQGCCFGKPTNLPWGVNFGDGVLRHPTQIYELIFCLFLFFYLHYKNKTPQSPGYLFKLFILWYGAFRFFNDFFRFEPKLFGPLTTYQIGFLVTLLIYSIINLWTVKAKFHKN